MTSNFRSETDQRRFDTPPGGFSLTLVNLHHIIVFVCFLSNLSAFCCRGSPRFFKELVVPRVFLPQSAGHRIVGRRNWWYTDMKLGPTCWATYCKTILAFLFLFPWAFQDSIITDADPRSVGEWLWMVVGTEMGVALLHTAKPS